MSVVLVCAAEAAVNCGGDLAARLKSRPFKAPRTLSKLTRIEFKPLKISPQSFSESTRIPLYGFTATIFGAQLLAV